MAHGTWHMARGTAAAAAAAAVAPQPPRRLVHMAQWSHGTWQMARVGHREMQSGHMAHGAKALPPQQRRRSRLNRRVASPRLAARALTPLVSARPNGIITRRSRREEREAVVPLRRRGSQQQRRLQVLPRARAQVLDSLRRMHQEPRPSGSTGLGLAGLLSARAGIATSTILIATRSMA